jgi:TPR repeat protein
VPQDPALAAAWYRKAADHGFKAAEDALRRIQSDGK